MPTAAKPLSGTLPQGSQTPRQLLDALCGSNFLLETMRMACREILDIYGRETIDIECKDNGSPVTEADLAAAAIIERRLATTNIPVICEEGVLNDGPAPELFWLVDPLDGTKEFINRNGEFTVNIALIANGEPIVGAIAIPVSGEIFTAIRGEGAYHLKRGYSKRLFNRRTGMDLIAATSRSYGSEHTANYLNQCGVTSTIVCGSAIKFCRVASGECDIYARLGCTMEWDTAAGQCILEEAGCKVIDLNTGSKLQYGKPEYRNPSFVACRGDLVLPSWKEA